MIQPQNGMFTGTNSKQSNAKRSSLKSWIVRGRLLLEKEARGFRQKTLKFGLNESQAQNENCGWSFIYIVLVIDYCASERVKISPACRALTISP